MAHDRWHYSLPCVAEGSPLGALFARSLVAVWLGWGHQRAGVCTSFEGLWAEGVCSPYWRLCERLTCLGQCSVRKGCQKLLEVFPADRRAAGGRSGFSSC